MKRKWITVEVLRKLGACNDNLENGIQAFEKRFTRISIIDLVKLAIKSEDNNHLDDANWLIVRCMSYKQYVSYAVYAAKQTLPFYESFYPEDKRPRQAIKAAEKCIKNPSKANRNAAHAFAYADAAAHAFAYAALAALAAYAADAFYARKDMQIKILKYGLKLLQETK